MGVQNKRQASLCTRDFSVFILFKISFVLKMWAKGCRWKEDEVDPQCGRNNPSQTRRLIEKFEKGIWILCLGVDWRASCSEKRRMVQGGKGEVGGTDYQEWLGIRPYIYSGRGFGGVAYPTPDFFL